MSYLGEIPILCNRCLTPIGRGHLAEHGDVIGGWIEGVEHHCPNEMGATG